VFGEGRAPFKKPEVDKIDDELMIDTIVALYHLIPRKLLSGYTFFFSIFFFLCFGLFVLLFEKRRSEKNIDEN
jgi:hypothetical protein